MDRTEEVRQWFFLAEQDLMAAEVLCKHHPRPGEIICFHKRNADKFRRC
jgi:hypothetical protein